MGCAGSTKKGSLEFTSDNRNDATFPGDIVAISREEYARRHRGTAPLDTETLPDPPPVPKIQGKYMQNNSFTPFYSVGRLSITIREMRRSVCMYVSVCVCVCVCQCVVLFIFNFPGA